MHLYNFDKKKVKKGIVLGGMIYLTKRDFLLVTNDFLERLFINDYPSHSEKTTHKQIISIRSNIKPVAVGDQFLFERCFNRIVCTLFNEKDYKNHNYLIEIV